MISDRLDRVRTYGVSVTRIDTAWDGGLLAGLMFADDVVFLAHTPGAPAQAMLRSAAEPIVGKGAKA